MRLARPWEDDEDGKIKYKLVACEEFSEQLLGNICHHIEQQKNVYLTQ